MRDADTQRDGPCEQEEVKTNGSPMQIDFRRGRTVDALGLRLYGRVGEREGLFAWPVRCLVWSLNLSEVGVKLSWTLTAKVEPKSGVDSEAAEQT